MPRLENWFPAETSLRFTPALIPQRWIVLVGNVYGDDTHVDGTCIDTGAVTNMTAKQAFTHTAVFDLGAMEATLQLDLADNKISVDDMIKQLFPSEAPTIPGAENHYLVHVSKAYAWGYGMCACGAIFPSHVEFTQHMEKYAGKV